MDATTVILILLATYLLGTTPTAWVALRPKGQDIREEGSGNVGAMNSFMVTKSKGTFFIVFIVDFLKGVLAVLAARYIAGETTVAVDALAILGVVLGHNFNIWLSVKRGRVEGGKGLAAGLGGLALSMWKIIPVWALFFALGYFLYKQIYGAGKIAPGTTVGTATVPIAAYVFYGPVAFGVMLITAFAIVIKHVGEMKELLASERSS